MDDMGGSAETKGPTRACPLGPAPNKRVSVFAGFTLYSEICSNKGKVSSKMGISRGGSYTYNRMSSAKRDILFCIPFTKMPDILSFNLIAWAKGSITRSNRAGERGHPCRVPRIIWNQSETMPFVFTVFVGEEYIDDKTAIKGSEKPIILNTLFKKCQLRRSKSFSASTLRSIETGKSSEDKA